MIVINYKLNIRMIVERRISWIYEIVITLGYFLFKKEVVLLIEMLLLVQY